MSDNAGAHHWLGRIWSSLARQTFTGDGKLRVDAETTVTLPDEYPLPQAQIDVLAINQPTTPADTQPVADDYAANEHEADQTGAGAVLTFTVTAAEFVMVDVDNAGAEDDTVYRARATLDGTDPTATTGFVCRSGTTTYLPFPTAGTVKVFAPAGTVVAVQTGRR